MSEYDDTIQINAQAVQPGDVLWNGANVKSVRIVGRHFVSIHTDKGDYQPRLDALVAVREVVTD
jgi:hypothetical protein